MGIYQPLAGSSYLPLPTQLKQPQLGIINVVNEDDEKCFLWSTLAALYPVARNPNRLSNYKRHENKLNMEGITYPVTVSQIRRFQTQNKISVTVLGYEQELYPLFISDEEFEIKVTLLLITSDDRSHYCCISDINRLLAHTNFHNAKMHYCIRCFSSYTTEENLYTHRKHCMEHDYQKVKLPSQKTKWLKFKDFQKQIAIPFVIYSDFECYLEKITDVQYKGTDEQGNPIPKRQQKIEVHKPSGYSYVIVSNVPGYKPKKTLYRGEDCVNKFVDALVQESKWILNILKTSKPMVFTKDDQLRHDAAKHCHICGFDLPEKLKVRDHCHFQGTYR